MSRVRRVLAWVLRPLVRLYLRCHVAPDLAALGPGLYRADPGALVPYAEASAREAEVRARIGAAEAVLAQREAEVRRVRTLRARCLHAFQSTGTARCPACDAPVRRRPRMLHPEGDLPNRLEWHCANCRTWWDSWTHDNEPTREHP